ncbi:MAG: HlyD family efflux transporter periplasmic adaptor subunit [Candidatus Paceibacterota bacterium]|jgi:RND family efflux transporter MFP subunit
MKEHLTKIKTYIIAHKIISIITLAIMLLLGNFVYGKITSTAGDTRYLTAKVGKGTIVASISGSGQVSASNQVDLKARATGEVTYIGVKPGDIVKKGKTLFGLNAKNAKKAVRDAETNLETVKLALEKFQRVPDDVAVLEIKKAIADAETSKLDAEKAIKDSYRVLLNTSISASSINISEAQTPPTITGTYIKDQEVVISIKIYATGSGSYFSADSVPAGIVNGAGTVSTVLPQPIGDSGLYIKFATTSSSQPTWTITLPNKSATTYNANNTAYQNSIDDQKKINDTANLTIAQNNKKLRDLYQPDEFDLRAKQLAVKQAQDNLLNAQSDLSDYYIFAPFDGVIATVDAKLGETSSAALGSIVTKQQLAEISLNEVDVAKIKLGQKTTLTFDAIPNLSISGIVADIDTIGAVSQGVVTYIVKISFDTQDERVKPGMSVGAAIITDIKQDVLTVPNGAIKSQSGTSYVEIFTTPPIAPTDGLLGSISKIPPNKIPIEVGLSNDSQTEIISGIKEGDEIVTRTILPSATKTAAAAPSLFGSPSTGTRGGGGGGLGR